MYLLSAGIEEGFEIVSVQPSEIVLEVQHTDCGGGLRRREVRTLKTAMRTMVWVVLQSDPWMDTAEKTVNF